MPPEAVASGAETRNLGFGTLHAVALQTNASETSLINTRPPGCDSGALPTDL
jgi:hypothetical protein